jgi:hypothetical protein
VIAFAAIVYGFVIENWLLVFGTGFILWYSNYVVFDMRRIVVNELSVQLKAKLKVYEPILRSEGFKL